MPLVHPSLFHVPVQRNTNLFCAHLLVQPLTFTDSILHWFSSSNEVPACVFKPETVPDLSVAMQIIASTQTPFAIYSGGHASNPGFSSTKGVHISMGKFNQIILSEDKKTVEIGFGNVSNQQST